MFGGMLCWGLEMIGHLESGIRLKLGFFQCVHRLRRDFPFDFGSFAHVLSFCERRD